SQTAFEVFNKSVEIYLNETGSAAIEEIMVIARIFGHLRMMYCALPTLNNLPVEVKNRCLSGYKAALKQMYFDRSDEVLSLVKKVTALF
ncbi:MAG: hypothetical protein ACI4Q6_03700, partial [Huintestinicola sp.]